MRAYQWDSSTAAATTGFVRRQLGDAAGLDEKWLQAQLFDHPDLLPLEDIDPAASQFVPVCRELSLPRAGRSVFLDILGVTPQGRIVLVECKLWRNPEARREVVAQIFEYATLLRQWSYSDLQARLKQQFGWTGANPLFEHVRRQHPETNESRFVEGVSRSLADGDFLLIIAGDGIRTDIDAVVQMLQFRSGLIARLGLVEIRLWSDDAGRVLAVPNVVLRTEVVRQRVLITPEGRPVVIEDEAEVEAEQDAGPQRADERRAANRAFWQSFIDEVAFDHPDQPKPTHGADNAVRAQLPKPAAWLTVYRAGRGSTASTRSPSVSVAASRIDVL